MYAILDHLDSLTRDLSTERNTLTTYAVAQNQAHGLRACIYAVIISSKVSLVISFTYHTLTTI